MAYDAVIADRAEPDQYDAVIAYDAVTEFDDDPDTYDAVTAYEAVAAYDAEVAVVADPDNDPVNDCAVTDCDTANDPLIVELASPIMPFLATNSNISIIFYKSIYTPCMKIFYYLNT